MVRLRIDRHHAGRALVGEAAVERRLDLVVLDRTGRLDGFRPEHDALVVGDRELVDVGHRVGAVHLAPGRGEGLVGGRVELGRVVVADDDAVALLGREHEVLRTDADRGRGERDAALHAGRRPLAVERQVRAADQRRVDHVGRRRLDLGDGRAEVGDVEREELDGDGLAAVVLEVLLDPAGHQLAVIVVGGEDVDLLAPLLHRVGDLHFGSLRGRHAGAVAVAVADAALVLDVVEIERVGLAQRRADRLARGRQDAAVDDVDLVLARQLLGVLRIQRHVRLRVVADVLDLPAEQAAGVVDLLDGQAHGHVDRLAVGVEDAGDVEHGAELDRVFGEGVADEGRAGQGRGGGCALEDCTSADGHVRSPSVIRHGSRRAGRDGLFSLSCARACG